MGKVADRLNAAEAKRVAAVEQLRRQRQAKTPALSPTDAAKKKPLTKEEISHTE